MDAIFMSDLGRKSWLQVMLGTKNRIIIQDTSYLDLKTCFRTVSSVSIISPRLPQHPRLTLTWNQIVDLRCKVWLRRIDIIFRGVYSHMCVFYTIMAYCRRIHNIGDPQNDRIRANLYPFLCSVVTNLLNSWSMMTIVFWGMLWPNLCMYRIRIWNLHGVFVWKLRHEKPRERLSLTICARLHFP